MIGASPERMAAFEGALLTALAPVAIRTTAWCVLPNHYHVLLQTLSIRECRNALGKLHGRTSREWNRHDDLDGQRKCWHRCLPREVTSEAQQWATMNYIHHNPVHHRYVERWQDWPFSSAAQFLASVPRQQAERIWRQYPIDFIGKGWDPPEA